MEISEIEVPGKTRIVSMRGLFATQSTPLLPQKRDMVYRVDVNYQKKRFLVAVLS